jgi:hypothetical protein
MTTYRFAFLVDGEFAAGSAVHDTLPLAEGMLAVFRSNPTIVEIEQGHPSFEDIGLGWTFDGENWNPPAA